MQLKFFEKFQIEIRMELISKAKLNHYKPDDEIYRQGETGDFLYIVVRGSVKVKMQNKEFGEIPLVINTLYDGDYFGELALFEESENLSKELAEELNKRKETTLIIYTNRSECD